MTAMPEFDVPISASETIRQISVHVKFKGLRLALWRLNLCAAIIKFAIWIGGLGGVRVTYEDLQ
jgi:hypothetical protein